MPPSGSLFACNLYDLSTFIIELQKIDFVIVVYLGALRVSSAPGPFDGYKCNSCSIKGYYKHGVLVASHMCNRGDFNRG